MSLSNMDSQSKYLISGIGLNILPRAFHAVNSLTARNSSLCSGFIIFQFSGEYWTPESIA